MWLEERDDATLRVAAARGVERGADLGGMMRVVVDDQRAGIVAEDLETAVDAEELGQRGGGDVPVDAELARHGDRGERVAHVVLAGHEEFEEADAFDFERRAALVELDIVRGQLRARAQAVAAGAQRNGVEQLRHHRVVHAAHHQPARSQVLHEDAERLDHRVERAEVLEMVGLDVGDDGDLGTKLMEGAVVLVRFDHEEVAASALGVGADVLQHAADEDGRIEAGLFEDQRDHRRRRGLAVRAGHADGALASGDGAEDLLALPDGDAAARGLVDLGVLAAHGGGDHDGVDAVEVRRIVADEDGDAALGQPLGGAGGTEVAAGDAQAAVGENFSNATHSDSSDADEMNALNVLEIHSVSGLLNHRFYSLLTIFSSKSTIFFVASGAASVRAAVPIRAARSGSLMISATASANRSGESPDSVMTIAPPARSTTRAFSS